MSEVNETKTAARRLMSLSMPPFAQFLDHTAVLRDECEKAGDLTPENAAAFDEWRNAMLAAREEYESAIENVIVENFSLDEVRALIEFFEGPAFALLQKSQSLGGTVAEIATEWRTRVLERCPAAHALLLGKAVEWQEKNQPANWRTVSKEQMSSENWKSVDAPRQAEEFSPHLSEEEREIENIRNSAPDSTPAA